jgi:lipopolysaccharide/colanic/teichoic acid biosynthesis glycosyltransferase
VKNLLEKTMPESEIQEFLSGFINLHDNNLVKINNDITKLPSSINNFSIIQIEGLMNNIRYINKLLEKINLNINDGTYIIGSFETFKSRRNRIIYYKIPILRYVYMLIEFLLLRVTPKINGINKLYFYLTKGRNRLLSKAEMLGRLVCCGFEIIGTRKIKGIDYFIVKRKNDPTFDMKASYGPIFGMQRIGKGGKIFKVYKFRTMHPYSEYLQDYILKINGYAKSGKPANDFRLTPWGKVFRKYWIDELPQLFNILKGDMKLVGVRPVSKRYFEDIPKELQILRITQKPGCIPPYVSLNRGGDVYSVQTAEKEYLLEKLKNPLSTDTKYFFKAIFNILIRKKRSA